MFWFHNTKTCNKPGKNGSKILGKLKAFYVNEWASFSTQDFPENRHPRDGDRVRIVMLDVPDRRPVEDFICTDAHYRRLFESAGLEVLDVQKPLATGKEATRWISETSTAPWTTYVLGRDSRLQ
jgi:hypothetical protein